MKKIIVNTLVFACLLFQIVHSDEYMEYPIISLERDSHYKGSFLIGTGSIDNEIYYYFYEKINGGYFFRKLNAESVEIIEYSGEPKHTFTFTKFDMWNYYCEKHPCRAYIYKNNKLYVPHGTIIRQMKL